MSCPLLNLSCYSSDCRFHHSWLAWLILEPGVPAQRFGCRLLPHTQITMNSAARLLYACVPAEEPCHLPGSSSAGCRSCFCRSIV